MRAGRALQQKVGWRGKGSESALSPTPHPSPSHPTLAGPDNVASDHWRTLPAGPQRGADNVHGRRAHNFLLHKPLQKAQDCLPSVVAVGLRMEGKIATLSLAPTPTPT